ncbi:MAG: DUF1573 domain-containing protein [Deltaproteobacteria bacterium]|nr:DUF1573 domain-containing protein [Deltaproteobacteria bacterium]
MNRITKLSVLVFITCLLFSLYTAPVFSEPNVKQPAPKISPIETHYDFGQISEGINVEHIFKIRNTGDSDLVIHQARGS